MVGKRTVGEHVRACGEAAGWMMFMSIKRLK
jgi:hypothetical protein